LLLRVKGARRVGAFITLTLISLAAACAGNAPRLDRAAVPQASLQSQLDTLPVPQGVDPADFAQLKAALQQYVDARAGQRTTSAPPSGPTAMVNDFNAELENGIVTFTWTYRNPGDYNQDGLAGISDLAPLGRYLNVNRNSPNWDEAQVADGTGDGAVTISDLSPLGSNLNSFVEGYLLRHTETPDDPDSWDVLADVPLDDANVDPATAKLRFSVELDLATTGREGYFQVVPYQGSAIGIGSNSDSIVATPPAISRVNPLGGQAGQVVTFSAEVFGDEPLQYAWNFGGGATPNTSTDPTPTVTLEEIAASYTGNLTVTNAVGQDSFQFVIAIQSNDPPTVQLSASPQGGPAPLEVTLTATASDPDGSIAKYEWDLNGDNSFEINGGTKPTIEHTFTATGAHVVRVRVMDNGGETATASTEVVVAALPVAVVTANQATVVAPDYVSLDASRSTSPNGPIVKYEWDWDGNGLIDANTQTAAFIRVPFDARTGTYQATVIVTDSTGAQDSASVPVIVTDTKFTLPPVEQYQTFPGGNVTQQWLKNVYSTLPEWRDANGPYQTAFFAEWADELFTRLNAYRASQGLPQCTRLVQLDLISQAHERDQALRSYFSHTNPEGLAPKQRIFAINPPSTLDNWAEIIGQGAETPEEEIQLWINSPGHKAIMDNPTLIYAGVGMYYKSNGAKGLEAYWSINFAAFKAGGPPPAGHNWLEPHEVVR
jgi:uncharacterized protein YkwD